MIDFLVQNDYYKIALETEEVAKQSQNSINIFEDFSYAQQENQKTQKEEKQKKIILFGNERFGIEKKLLLQMDQVFYIPMNGYKNSINVALTAAIAGFYFIAKNTPT